VLFTTRAGSNLSSRSGDGRELAQAARARLRADLGLHSLAHARQVHGSRVLRVEAREAAAEEAATDAEADGLASSAPGVGLLAFTADCLPVALAGDGAVAMVHAGWRGLASGVLEEGVGALRALARDSEIVAAIGPGAGACCYEVGEEVHAAFGATPRVCGYIDLKALARERLRAAGVREVRDVGVCTICDERFFSHRREGDRAGRQAGVAWLR
jgi:YfiH family protein